MPIIMIAAYVKTADGRNLIGKSSEKTGMPWPSLKSDFKHFKDTTLGHTIVMGSKTYDSIGRPLPGRKTIVLSNTRSQEDYPEGVVVCRSRFDILDLAKTQIVFMCGGGIVYETFMPWADELIITEIFSEVYCEGDVFFPEIWDDQWTLKKESERIQNEGDHSAMQFRHYVRKNPV